MASAQSHCRSMTQYVQLFFTLLIGNATLVSFTVVTGENIAFYTPTGSYSHRVSMWPLVEKLVANGHHITFISAYPPKNPLPNVTEIIPEQMAKHANDYMQGGDLDITRRISGTLEPCYDHGPRLGLDTCEKFLDDPVVKKWLETDPKIDLFIVDWFVSECILGLAYKQKAPFILYAPTVMVSIFYETFGFLPDSAGIPDFEHHFTPPMSFLERANNAMQPLIYLYKMGIYYDELGKMIREKLDIPDMPPLQDIVRNASLMMWSESVIEGYAHSLPPNWITVGGMHCKEKTDPLPKDLEQIVQKGKDGFIYISFGSAVVPGNLPQGHRDAFFNAIKAFPNIQFLWKWTGIMPQEAIPSNLYIGNWFPQQFFKNFKSQILNFLLYCTTAHKNILAFVTQAGRPSTQEAIFHGVPVIVVPVFEDQDYTAERIRDMGGGIKVEIATITKEEFEGAIREITTDPKFKSTMKRLSTIFRDRPMKPADLAFYWTEYVLRHKGNLDHFRTSSYHLTWYQRRLLDVWAAIIGAFFVLSTILLIFIACCLKSIFKSNNGTSKNVKGLAKKKRQ
ncbi:UDP-glucuronosyltransferase 1-3 [Orchesella cincta]|uniref:UDP-glucuronosyltransferase 1-3 n=1 Tax=Orchesella cincta TaxID=48709 RepID=A0A1D2N045_ORCCI|nr:UDP-glucuronosyltransferase 1-3 [Orchesella cincta]